jgi:hypothetical protein
MISHRGVVNIKCGVVDILVDAAQIVGELLSGESKPKNHIRCDLVTGSTPRTITTVAGVLWMAGCQRMTCRAVQGFLHHLGGGLGE